MNYYGASRPNAEDLGVLPLAGVNHVYDGSSLSVVEAPEGASGLVLHAEAGAWRVRAGNHRGGNFTVNATTDTASLTGHGRQTGDGPFKVESTTTLPDPLAEGTDYWAIRVDDDNFKFALSRSDALDGIAVDLTDTGTGTHSVVALTAGAPSADEAGGHGSFLLEEGKSVAFAAPAQGFTCMSGGATDVLTYWWF